MIKFLKKIFPKIKKQKKWSPTVHSFENLTTIGTKYGGWTIPDNFLSSESICYLAGAGEDISFDVGIVKRYNCQVYVFDPTPRAKKHFELLIDGIYNDKKVPINNSETNFYELSSHNIKYLNYIALGLWNQNKRLKFYSPQKPEHVSHSILNLQKTDSFFFAEVDRLSSIMKRLGHQELDLLKIDIEGAEYKVIESIIEDNLRIKAICVEYDEAFNPLDNNFKNRIKTSVTKLENFGYKIIAGDKNHNYTFLRDDQYEQLKIR